MSSLAPLVPLIFVPPAIKGGDAILRVSFFRSSLSD